MRWRRCLGTLFLTGMFVGAVAGADQKAEPPDAQGQRAAAKLVREVYADDVSKAKRPDERSALAAKLLAAGVAERKDAAARYALFVLAREMAADAGDLDGACKAVDEADRVYRIDAPKMKAEAAASAGRAARSPEERLMFVAQALPVIDEMIKTDRYELARQVNELALSRAAGDAPSQRLVAARVQRTREAETGYAEYKKTLATLAQQPNDPEANLKAGKFLCLVKGDWAGGLPMLARGADATLKALALGDLASPDTAERQASQGDAWWDLGQKSSGTVRAAYQGRAVKWYQDALPQLPAGLAKARVEQRIKIAGGGDQAAQKAYLTRLTPKSAETGDKGLGVNKYPHNPSKKPVLADGPVEEFLAAHAPSSLTYAIPAGSRGFSARGMSMALKEIVFVVKVDGKEVYRSEQLDEYADGVAKISVALPAGAKEIQLITLDVGGKNAKHSVWCWPCFER
ncbi:MAG: hypothetical protein JWN40_2885 [Phycisphaerales bacterium]|nr:hypothetical protein [Phycisphaerales bacterium]